MAPGSPCGRIRSDRSAERELGAEVIVVCVVDLRGASPLGRNAHSSHHEAAGSSQFGFDGWLFGAFAAEQENAERSH